MEGAADNFRCAAVQPSAYLGFGWSCSRQSPHTNNIPEWPPHLWLSARWSLGSSLSQHAGQPRNTGRLMFPAQPSRNGDERPLNRCLSLLFSWGTIRDTFYPVPQGPQPDWAPVVHSGNQLSNTTLCGFSAFVASVSLLPPPLWLPRVASHINSLDSPHQSLSPAFIPYRSHWRHSDRRNKKEAAGCRELLGDASTLTAMFTVRCPWDHMGMTSVTPTQPVLTSVAHTLKQPDRTFFALFVTVDLSLFDMLHGHNTSQVFLLCFWLLLRFPS